jgi:chromosomal replication initiation ATPase DnaA
MLKRWAAVEGVHMIEEVCSLISARTGSNLRETHGACGRLSAFAWV